MLRQVHIVFAGQSARVMLEFWNLLHSRHTVHMLGAMMPAMSKMISTQQAWAMAGAHSPGVVWTLTGHMCMRRDELGRVVLGDVITGIDGKPIKLQRDLFEILDEKRPGDKISIDVLRDGSKQSFMVTLGGRDVTGAE